MSEFNFPCPQCRQPIQYPGAQIICPSCGQTVTAPRAASGAGGATADGAVQIKISTLRAAALIGAGVVLAAALVWLPIHLFAGPKTMTFRAFVDGTDLIKMSGNRLWIEHLDSQLPVKMKVNGEKWNPTWDGDMSRSTTYKLRRAFSPATPETIKLVKHLGRGEVSIAEKPAPDNNGTLAIKLDDGPYGGADWYEFTVSW